MPLIVLAMTATGRPVVDGSKRLEQLREVVAVDHARLEAERDPLVGQRLELLGLLGARALLQAVAVDDRGQVGEVVVGGGHRRLPVGALLQLAVAEDDERAVSPCRAAWRPARVPTPTGKPWPSGPVLVSTPGTLVRFGWPLSAESGAMNVLSSARGKKPQWASVAYRAPAQWPLERMKRSRSARGRVGRVDVQHRAEERDEDVRDREITADVPEAGAVDHRHDRRGARRRPCPGVRQRRFALCERPIPRPLRCLLSTLEYPFTLELIVADMKVHDIGRAVKRRRCRSSANEAFG